jgi:hypothetical protein
MNLDVSEYMKVFNSQMVAGSTKMYAKSHSCYISLLLLRVQGAHWSHIQRFLGVESSQYRHLLTRRIQWELHARDRSP